MVLGMKFWASIISTIRPSFLIFGHLNISRVLGVLKPHTCGVKKEIEGPNRPHDAHDAGSLGAAGRLNCAINPNETLKIHAVGSVCGCKNQ